MSIKFKEFLYKKYGAEITEKLYQDGKLYAENITKASEDNNGQELVKKHLNLLNDNLKLNLQIIENDKNWAFDFSGWIGILNFNENHVREYMVVGLEPHIEEYNYQITYGLSDKTPKNEQRFSIEPTKSEYVNCKGDSSIIWTNLFKLFASEKITQEVKEENNEIALTNFLNQFYILDLCHFAPKDKANAINGVNKWSEIRKKVANEFLKTEIDLINPKIIIAQGSGVFKEIKSILNVKESIIGSVPFGKKNWNIKVAYYNDTKIISIPHIGSLMTHKTFWLKNLIDVKDILHDEKTTV
jgi:hypothetical protein